jgi:ketosteroid isomerase-like protein
MVDESNVEARLRELELRVRELEDRDALAQIVASYGPAVDSGQAAAAAALWFDDGVFDVVPYFELVGHDGIAGMVDGEGHQSLIHNGCGHVLTAPKVVVAGDNARGWNYAFNIRWDGEADRFWIARLSANEWEFRRHGDAWRVVRRTNINLDGDERPRALLRHSTEPSGGTS